MKSRAVRCADDESAIMKNGLTRVLGAMVLCLAGTAAQASWSLGTWVYNPGVSPSLTLNGGSTDSCIPNRDTVVVSGQQITVHLSYFVAVPPALCFSAGRPWSYGVNISNLPAGTYDVTVTDSAPSPPATLGTFSIVVPAGAVAPQAVPALGPAAMAALASLLALGAGWILRRRRVF
jgi:hypothetical protein